MELIKNYHLKLNKDNSYTLYVHLDDNITEFSQELGNSPQEKENLQKQVRRIIKERYPNIQVNAVKVLAGSILVATFYLGSASGTSAQTSSSSVQQVQYSDYVIKSGDNLSALAKRYQISIEDIKKINGLTSNTIYVGQVIKLPVFTYTVVSGDALSKIAKTYNTSVETLRNLNGLTSDLIRVGQQIIIPITINTGTNNTGTNNTGTNNTVDNSTVSETNNTEQTYRTYTVISGDSLSRIAKEFDTSVTAIKSANGLSTDLIRIGQQLKIPVKGQATVSEEISTQQPKVIEKYIDYKVVSGDSLWRIAKNYNITVTELKTINNLRSDLIKIGQTLQIPTQVEVESQPIVPKSPTILTSDPVTNNNVTSYIISGSSEAGTTVTVAITDSENKSNSKQVLVDETGKFIAGFNLSTFQDGSLTVKSVAVNKAGSSLANVISITKNTTPVNPSMHHNEVVTGATAGSFKVVGQSDANTTIHLIVNDGENEPIIKEVKPNADGTYEANFDLRPLKDGVLTISAFSKSLLGVKSELVEKNIQKITKIEAPELSINEEVTIENANNFLISGTTTEPGYRIETTITDSNNKQIRYTTTSSNVKQYSQFVDLRELSDGSLTVNSQAIDKYGNKSSLQTVKVTKNTAFSAPTVDPMGVISKANVKNYSVTGIAYPNTTVQVVFTDAKNGVINDSVQTGDDGKFAITLDTTPLQDGPVSLRTTQISNGGVISEINETVFHKDTVSPSGTTINNGGIINSELQSTYVIAGEAEPNAIIKILITDSLKNLSFTTNANENGEYRLPIGISSLENGKVLLEITQEDRYGNKSEVISKELIKETNYSIPFLLDNDENINIQNEASYQFIGRTLPDSLIEVSVNDGTKEITETAISDQEGNFNIPTDVRSLSDGEMTALFTIKDHAGNKIGTKTVTIVKDTVIPKEFTMETQSFITKENVQNFIVSGTGVEDGTKVSILATDGVFDVVVETEVINGNYEAVVDLSTLQDGIVTFKVTQKDKVGNVSEVKTKEIEKDTIIENPIVTKSGFSYLNGMPVYTVIGTGSPGSTVKVYVNDKSNELSLTESTKANARGYFTLHVPLEGISSTKDLEVTIEQFDQAGNVSDVGSVPVQAYIVVNGDSLHSIAKRFNTTVDALRSLNNLTTDTIQVGQQLRLVASASEVINLGYIYFGNSEHFINTVNSTSNSVNVVAPSYFDINPDGTLKLTYQLDSKFINEMHAQGIRVVPFLSNHWDRAVGRAMLANKELAARQIADAIEKYNLDGVNVDIENVTDADRDNFTAFVRLLREAIPMHKEVSVAVAANPNGWNTGWHGSYDYTNLAKYSDYLMIMAYDESYYGGDPGPVASLPWVERSIQYAIDENVPRHKIVIGLAHYGRYWKDGASTGGYGISNNVVDHLLERYNGAIVFDGESQSPKATITIRDGDPVSVVSGRTLGPGTYTIWYENEDSISQKLALVSKYNIRGVGTWSLGQGNLEVFNSYATTLPTTVPIEVLANAPSEEQQAYPTTSNYTLYKVVSGDTLSEIAQRFGTTVNAIKESNNLSRDTIYIGQSLKIPNGESAVVEKQIHKVVAGDTLWGIAREYNTTVDSIKIENNLSSDTIKVGQELRIP